MKKVPAQKFQADCLALIDEAHKTGEPLTITRRGREIARLIPVEPSVRKGKFLGRLEGIIEIVGDIESPVEPPEAWTYS
jgi:prevent-host-death family protein